MEFEPDPFSSWVSGYNRNIYPAARYMVARASPKEGNIAWT